MSKCIPWFLAIGILGGLVVTFVVVVEATTYVDWIWVDPVTGSIQTQRRWDWWGDEPNQTRLSPLVGWIESHEGGYQPQWKLLSRSQHLGIWGNGFRACTVAPPAYGFSHCPEVIQSFINHAPESHVAQLIQTMRQGDEAAREHAVNAALELGLANL